MMVAALHAAGIEVMLDVVYNHTAEGNQLGPTLSMRGVDNAAYYRLSPEDPRYYMDFTGCGNSPVEYGLCTLPGGALGWRSHWGNRRQG